MEPTIPGEKIRDFVLLFVNLIRLRYRTWDAERGSRDHPERCTCEIRYFKPTTKCITLISLRLDSSTDLIINVCAYYRLWCLFQLPLSTFFLKGKNFPWLHTLLMPTGTRVVAAGEAASVRRKAVVGPAGGPHSTVMTFLCSHVCNNTFVTARYIVSVWKTWWV